MSLITIFIGKMLAYIFALTPIYIILRYFYLKVTKSKISIKREILLGLFSMYFIGLLSQTIIPVWKYGFFNGKFFLDVFINNKKSINLIPFHTMYQYIFTFNKNVDSWNQVSILNLAANATLFIPFGFFIPILFKSLKSIKKIIIMGFLTSCIIEIIQYFIGRSADIDDVILNVIGVVIGYFIFALLNLKYKHICNI